MKLRAKVPRPANASSPPKVTMSAGDEGQVERIVISGPSPATSPASAAAQPNTSHGTIKIRATSDEVERLPVKAIGSKD